jgi:putative DNA primase/helicase
VRLSVREVAKGKWQGILTALGFDNDIMNGKHQPCPSCGGVDRFRWDDKDGNGTFYCSQCGAGDGVTLVMRVKDWDFRHAALEIEKAAGFIKPQEIKQGKTDADIRTALRRMWQESKPVVAGDPVTQYLIGRGLMVPDGGAIRYAPSIWYRDDSMKLRCQAMLALVTGADGEGKSIHRTFLQGGKKASVATPKKLMPGFGVSGAAIRLFQPGPCLGIAEGIESAIGASMRFHVPVWAAISAGGMESWIPPEGVTEVVVFGDNDENMVGQRAAYALASRLNQKGLKVRVEIPSVAGKDWADHE